MARRGRKFDPETEFKHFISSMEDFLHRGQYPSLTILLEGILNYLMQKEREFYLQKKGKENIGFWTEVLQDLISRGLSKVAIFVTDHFNGLEKLIPKLFPLSDHQFCFVHLYRNLKNKLTLKSMKEVYQLWKAIREASDIEEGQRYFRRVYEDGAWRVFWFMEDAGT